MVVATLCRTKRARASRRPEHRLQHPRQREFTNPPERQTRHRNAQLRPAHDAIQVGDQLESRLCARVSLRGLLLQPRSPDAHQSKFDRSEKGVDQDDENDCEDVEKRNRRHAIVGMPKS